MTQIRPLYTLAVSTHRENRCLAKDSDWFLAFYQNLCSLRLKIHPCRLTQGTAVESLSAFLDVDYKVANDAFLSGVMFELMKVG